MNISAELAKKIWKDDPEMLAMATGWETIRCIAEISNDLLLTLTPMTAHKDSGGGIASWRNMDHSPIGKPAKVQLFLNVPIGSEALRLTKIGCHRCGGDIGEGTYVLCADCQKKTT